MVFFRDKKFLVLLFFSLLFSCLWQCSKPVWFTSDSLDYFIWAKAIAGMEDGRFISHRTPGYPLLLLATGVIHFKSLWGILIIQALMATAIPLLAYGIVRCYTTEKLATLSGFLVLFTTVPLTYSRHIMTEQTSIFLLFLLLFIASRHFWSGRIPSYSAVFFLTVVAWFNELVRPANGLIFYIAIFMTSLFFFRNLQWWKRASMALVVYFSLNIAWVAIDSLFWMEGKKPVFTRIYEKILFDNIHAMRYATPILDASHGPATKELLDQLEDAIYTYPANWVGMGPEKQYAPYRQNQKELIKRIASAPSIYYKNFLPAIITLAIPVRPKTPNEEYERDYINLPNDPRYRDAVRSLARRHVPNGTFYDPSYYHEQGIWPTGIDDKGDVIWRKDPSLFVTPNKPGVQNNKLLWQRIATEYGLQRFKINPKSLLLGVSSQMDGKMLFLQLYNAARHYGSSASAGINGDSAILVTPQNGPASKYFFDLLLSYLKEYPETWNTLTPPGWFDIFKDSPEELTQNMFKKPHLIYHWFLWTIMDSLLGAEASNLLFSQVAFESIHANPDALPLLVWDNLVSSLFGPGEVNFNHGGPRLVDISHIPLPDDPTHFDFHDITGEAMVKEISKQPVFRLWPKIYRVYIFWYALRPLMFIIVLATSIFALTSGARIFYAFGLVLILSQSLIPSIFAGPHVRYTDYLLMILIILTVIGIVNTTPYYAEWKSRREIKPETPEKPTYAEPII